jgi:hypothetical protein
MAFELVYTSAQKGLKTGSSGFCTVAYTREMPANLVDVLESLSIYKPEIPAYAPNAHLNPVSYSHYRYNVGAQSYNILSRICFAGFDYSKRSNKLAHHIVLDANERISGGPSSLFRVQNLFLSSWGNREPELLVRQPSIPSINTPLRIAENWKAITGGDKGDAGWAGVLAESFLKNPDKPSYIVFTPGMEMLPLVDEALMLLPPEQRWRVTFNTYFTMLPQGVKVSWRFCLPDSPELKAAKRSGTLIIDLTAAMPLAEGGPLLEIARTGIIPEKKIIKPVSQIVSEPEIDEELAGLPMKEIEPDTKQQKKPLKYRKSGQGQRSGYSDYEDGDIENAESILNQSHAAKLAEMQKKLSLAAATVIILAGIVFFLMLKRPDIKSSSSETSPSVVSNMDSDEATAKKEILIFIGSCKKYIDEKKKEEASMEYTKAEEILKKGRIAEGERDALWKQLAELKKIIEPNQVSEIPNPTNTEKTPETAVKESEKIIKELAEKEDAAKKIAEEEKGKAEEAKLADLEKSKNAEEKKKAEQERQAIETRDKKIIAEFFYNWKTDVLDKPENKAWEIELPSYVTKDSKIIFTFDNTNDKDIPYPYKKCYKPEEPFIIKQTSGLMDQPEDYLKFSISSKASKSVFHIEDISKIEGNKAIGLKNITSISFDSKIELQTVYTDQPIEEKKVGTISFDSKALKISGSYPLAKIDQYANINDKAEDIKLSSIKSDKFIVALDLKALSKLWKIETSDNTTLKFSFDVFALKDNKPIIDKLMAALNSEINKGNDQIKKKLIADYEKKIEAFSEKNEAKNATDVEKENGKERLAAHAEKEKKWLDHEISESVIPELNNINIEQVLAAINRTIAHKDTRPADKGIIKSISDRITSSYLLQINNFYNLKTGLDKNKVESDRKKEEGTAIEKAREFKNKNGKLANVNPVNSLDDINTMISNIEKAISEKTIEFNRKSKPLDKQDIKGGKTATPKPELDRLQAELTNTRGICDEIKAIKKTYDEAEKKYKTDLAAIDNKDKALSSCQDLLAKSIEAKLPEIAKNLRIEYSIKRKVIKTVSFTDGMQNN